MDSWRVTTGSHGVVTGFTSWAKVRVAKIGLGPKQLSRV